MALTKLYPSDYNQKLLQAQSDLSPDLFERHIKIDSELNEQIQASSLNYFQDSWRRLKKNKGAMIALFFAIFIVGVAFLAPWISPFDPNAQHPEWAKLAPKIPWLAQFGIFDGMGVNRAGIAYDVYAQKGVPADVYFTLGTDALGRDLLSRILHGTRISLIVAFVAALINLVLGIIYGLISGWLGGKVDTVMQRILEILTGIPNLVIVVLMLLLLRPGLLSIIITIALTSWITMSRVVRAQTLRLKNQEYVIAARVLGQSPLKIMFQHILPNMLGIIIVQVMFAIPSAIFFEAFLSFIGIGIPAPQASLGTLINDGYQTFRFLPHLMCYPALMISVLMLSFNILADGLRDAFDPREEE
ncbi:ABC transporter permease [Eremococcus coleocola]|uniref:ABC transporter permease n=1 Tax=Eremococcus coleocola TaxID=88132 RepID=UPI00041FA0E7|nr:ABC transporter permease [Eremococcus coleocola]